MASKACGQVKKLLIALVLLNLGSRIKPDEESDIKKRLPKGLEKGASNSSIEVSARPEPDDPLPERCQTGLLLMRPST